MTGKAFLVALIALVACGCGETTADEPVAPYWVKRFGMSAADRASLKTLVQGSEIVIEAVSEQTLKLAGETVPAGTQFFATLDRAGHLVRVLPLAPGWYWVLPDGGFIRAEPAAHQPIGPTFLERFTADGDLVWRWEQSWAGSGEVLDLSADPAGNLLLRGIYDESLDKHFVAKLSPAGELVWVTTVEKTYIESLHALADGSAVYVTQDLLYDPDPMVGPYRLTKLDVAGAKVWELDGLFWDYSAVGVDPNGTIFLAYGCEPWPPPPPVPPYDPYYPPLLLCLDAVDKDGTLRWQRSIAIEGFSLERWLWDLAVGSGRVAFFGQVTTEPSASPDSAQPAGVVLVELDLEGNVLSIRGPQPTVEASAGGVAIDDQGDIYLAGAFTGHLDFKDWQLQSLDTAEDLDRDVFVAKVPKR